MSTTALHLPPGFRFHPTDEELILHYLRNRASSSPCPVSIIAEVDIYKFDPWKLPVMASFGDREWYFFSPRDRKYPNGIRPNRAAASGYWKATGTDKPISSGTENIGVKKALVFYKGRPPKGVKTDWIMHEYRLADAHNINCYKPARLRDHSMRLDDWVLCRIYRKSNNFLPPEDQSGEEAISQDDFCQKAPSMPEFIDNYSPLPSLFDNQPEPPRFDAVSFSSHPLLCNGYFLPELSAEFPSSIGAKRPRMPEAAAAAAAGGCGIPKKQSDLNKVSNFPAQFDGSQYGLLNQPFLSHQLLINSHIGSL